MYVVTRTTLCCILDIRIVLQVVIFTLLVEAFLCNLSLLLHFFEQDVINLAKPANLGHVLLLPVVIRIDPPNKNITCQADNEITKLKVLCFSCVNQGLHLVVVFVFSSKLVLWLPRCFSSGCLCEELNTFVSHSFIQCQALRFWTFNLYETFCAVL